MLVWRNAHAIESLARNALVLRLFSSGFAGRKTAIRMTALRDNGAGWMLFTTDPPHAFPNLTSIPLRSTLQRTVIS